MKEAELRACVTCAVCGKKIGETGLPMFWRVRIERHGIDMGAVQRQTGLAMLLGGNGILASAMGADEEMTVPLREPIEFTVCETCCTRETCVAQLAETAYESKERMG